MLSDLAVVPFGALVAPSVKWPATQMTTMHTPLLAAVGIVSVRQVRMQMPEHWRRNDSKCCPFVAAPSAPG